MEAEGAGVTWLTWQDRPRQLGREQACLSGWGREDCTGRLEKGLWLWVLRGAGPDHPAGSEPGFGHLKRYAV